MYDRNSGCESQSLRKIRKPLVEKKRRERINTCLSKLKNIIVEHMQGGVQVSKLDKAEILEMTVKHLRGLKDSANTETSCARKTIAAQRSAGYNACAKEALRFIGATCSRQDTKLRLQHQIVRLTETYTTEGENNQRVPNTRVGSDANRCLQPISIQVPEDACFSNTGSQTGHVDLRNSLLIPVTMYHTALERSDYYVTDRYDVSFDSNNDSGVYSNTSCISSPSSSVESPVSPAHERVSELIWRPW